ncbi:hypothetical protein ZWY2020_008920 [Hordeum vulgare]|nr:hypothetical protein ZWY2020_008920 [Hordeum vulgare]
MDLSLIDRCAAGSACLDDGATDGDFCLGERGGCGRPAGQAGALLVAADEPVDGILCLDAPEAEHPRLSRIPGKGTGSDDDCVDDSCD